MTARTIGGALPLAILALALAPPGAVEAASLGTIPVDPNGGVQGNFAAPGTQTWNLSLQRDRNYALWGWETDGATVAVRAAGGRQLGEFQMFTEGQPHGVSFKAPYTGLYTVAVTCPPPDDVASCSLPGDSFYELAAGRDCPGDLSTRCGIAVGGTLRNLQQRFWEDSDWFRTTLQAGASYALSVALPDCSSAYLALHDARGGVLAWTVTPDCDGSLAFAAPVGGTYYVEVGVSDDPNSTYDLTLARTR